MSRDVQPIEAGVVYPLSEFEKRSGLGRHAMRQARKNGLQVIRFSGRAFVRGQDFLRFLEALAETEPTESDS